MKAEVAECPYTRKGNTSSKYGFLINKSYYYFSSHAKVISGQNLRNRFSSFYQKPSRLSHGISEIYPSKGEVQERFNPRPYLEYLHVPPRKHQTSSGSSQASQSSPVYGTPFDSFPVFNSQSGADSNPPNSKPFDGGMESNGGSFNLDPPIMNEKDNGGSEDSMTFPMDSYQPTKEDDAKPMGGNNEYPGFPYAPPDDMSSKEPSKETPSEDTSDTGPEVVATMKGPEGSDYHSYQQYQDFGPKIVNTVRPPGAAEMPYQDHPPVNYYGAMDNDKPMDNPSMEGPPQDMEMPKQMPHGVYPKLPDYLDHDPKEHGHHYPDFYHYDHHVYHPITTTTTTTAAPEQRVNNNYSYYYLGRKLWYIPLYFSAYFIIYITVLILKSIARHKVSFWQDLHNLGSSRRLGRNMKLDEINRNVTDYIESARYKYMK